MNGPRGTVLVVDDDPNSAELISHIIGEEGFETVVAPTAGEGLTAFDATKPIAVLVDWVLPDLSGGELCRQLRAKDALVPIIFVSARDDETSLVRGLDAGADDYITKPFRPRELVARLEAHLRLRGHGRQSSVDAVKAQVAPGDHASFGDVTIDRSARRVLVSGQDVQLGPLEFELLDYLSKNPGVALSRDQILSNVYGYDADIVTDRIDVLVRRVRAKLGKGPGRGDQLAAVPGYGYRLES